MRRLALVLVVGIWLTGLAPSARGNPIRIKELVDVRGVRSNPLVGVGLVVGLSGTGDDATSAVTRRALVGMMKKLGLSIDAAQIKQIKAKNVALVMVTATLPPFARAGATIDVLISSAGTARSLQGGTLVLTPLKGADMSTYALAQGPLSLGGFSAEGETGSKVIKNHPTVGRIPGGARVEVDAPGTLAPGGEIELILHDPDFTTASRIAAAVIGALGDGTAEVSDPGAVTVLVPKDQRRQVVAILTTIEALEIEPDEVARVIINERTGTIVVGDKVRLGAATIAQGGITVRVQEEQIVSQPGGIATEGGETVVVPKTTVEVEEKEGRLTFVAGAATAGDVANALNTLGVKPRDLVAVFQALKEAGALRAEIILQ